MRCRLLAPLLALAAGCMVPQDLEEVVPAPVRNSPPRILGRLPEPPLDPWRTIQVACGARQRLTITAIEDFDEADDLAVRWYIGGALQQENLLPGGAVENGIRNPPGASFEFFVNEHGSRFTVRAVVSDGFDPEVDPEAAIVVLPGKDWDEAIWNLEVTAEGSCAE
jgi:hypothetical protein